MGWLKNLQEPPFLWLVIYWYYKHSYFLLLADHFIIEALIYL